MQINQALIIKPPYKKEPLNPQLNTNNSNLPKPHNRTQNPHSKMEIQNPRELPKKSAKLIKSLTPIITTQHYTSLHIKHLGNHSLFKRTTSSTRYNDPRLKFLKSQYFQNRNVLDIGCNEGFLDIEIAMKYSPKKIYAIDIDHKLIKSARKTLFSMVKKQKNYQDVTQNQKIDAENSIQSINSEKNQKKEAIQRKIQGLPLFFQDRLKEKLTMSRFLPEGMQLNVAPSGKIESKFPFNIKFEPDNIYTIKYQEDLLQYDTIMCLKVTKWIHLTFGDDGIRRLFQKIYDLLRLQGILILQAQDWGSYKRNKNVEEVYKKNYDEIELGPDQFEKVLVDDPLKEFKFQLVDKIQRSQSRNQPDKGLDYPILILKKKSTMLYY